MREQHDADRVASLSRIHLDRLRHRRIRLARSLQLTRFLLPVACSSLSLGPSASDFAAMLQLPVGVNLLPAAVKNDPTARPR